jgi:hypothetical protein
VFAGTSAIGRPSMLQPMLGQIFEPAMPQAIGRAVTRMAADYTFVTEGLPPGRYFLRVPSPLTPRGWHFESAVSDEGDLTIHPLDLQSAHAGEVVITFSDQPTGLRGLVVDPAGAPATDAAVLVFPLASDEWIRDGMNPAAVHHSAVSQAGMYTADVPPGDYLVTAVRPADAAGWFDPGVLRRLLSNASRVTLTRGVVLQHNLRSP